jgi:geranylgeranyl diphosphate synthase type II
MPAKQLVTFLTHCQGRVAAGLEQVLSELQVSPQLQQAMAYSLLGEGKRVRASLVYAAAEAVGSQPVAADAPAAAVEALHAYSLVHDDLPAMDDDNLRRGKPSCHCAYNEATAILVGDALQALAFELLSVGDDTGLKTDRRLIMISILARAAGARGMVAGQMLDMEAEGQQLTQAQLEIIHQHKTGALISASVELGALTDPDVSTDQQRALAHYGRIMGLAFQIQDDILDIESDTKTLGKPSRSDLSHVKSTYPAVLGIPQARKLLQQLQSQALTALGGFGASAAMLRELVYFMIQRDH